MCRRIASRVSLTEIASATGAGPGSAVAMPARVELGPDIPRTSGRNAAALQDGCPSFPLPFVLRTFPLLLIQASTPLFA